MSKEDAKRIEGVLKAGGVATKEVECYGSQVVVTCWCQDTARKVFRILQAASFHMRGLIKTIDYAKENKGTCLIPSRVVVWRVFAAI